LSCRLELPWVLAVSNLLTFFLSILSSSWLLGNPEMSATHSPDSYTPDRKKRKEKARRIVLATEVVHLCVALFVVVTKYLT
jgi:hypothetical protein